MSCYHKRMARDYNKKIKPRTFNEGDMVFSKILPFNEDPVRVPLTEVPT